LFRALSRLTLRRTRLVLAGGGVFVLASLVFGIGVFDRLKGGGFDDPDCESARARGRLEAHMGFDRGVLVVLFSAKDALRSDSAGFRAAAEEVLARMRAVPGVGSVTSYWNTSVPRFLSRDRRHTFALVGAGGDQGDQQALAARLRPLAASDRLQVRLGGYPAVFEEINEHARKDLRRAELISFPIVALLLLLIFGSVVATLLPIVVGVVTILGSFLVLRVASSFTDISVYAANLVSMLGLGLAIDYSLFVVSRFREELLKHGGEVREALKLTLDTAGRTVLFSGVTVAISLLSLHVFPLMFLKSMGTGGAAAVVIATITSLTVLPAVLAALGGKVNALSVRRKRSPVAARAPAGREGSTGSGLGGNAVTLGFWFRMSHFVMAHPGVVLAITLVALAAAGSPFLRARFAIPDARVLPQGSESRIVSEILKEQFGRNETEPIQIAVESERPLLEEPALASLYDYVQVLAALPGVTRVDSLFSAGTKAGKAESLGFFSVEGRRKNPRLAISAARQVRDRWTVVGLLYDSEPNSDASKDLVRRIRALRPPQGLSVLVGGPPAGLMDFLDTLALGVPRSFVLIVAAIFVLLFLMFGSLVIPLKAVLLNVLSLSVSYGALVWIFQDGHLASILRFTPLGSIDGTQPVLIFAIAFGLSMDYEVFLLSRIKEHYDETGDAKAAVALGVEKTGGIITSAALLLVVVIASFATGEVVFVKQIGIGLSLAILVDATIVRMLLVPATMQLMGRYNWWAPKPLARLHERLGLSEVGERAS
jgi:RND superfamily putative drug exporter